MLTGSDLDSMANDLVEVAGVVGVVLGGSRARGDALPSSDADVGVYYEGSPDVDALTDLAREWSEQDVAIGPSGSWGSWVDTGGWLLVDDTRVDWILRDLDRVRDQCARAHRGEFAFHMQTGHPLGFLDVAYAGELALACILADPDDALADLRATVVAYPEALRRALPGVVGEAGFFVDIATKAVARRDTAYVSSCLTRACLLCAHALHAREGRWVTNEKGLVTATDSLHAAPADFASRVAGALGAIGTTPASLTAAIGEVRALLDETIVLMQP